ncbi:MAG TPA: radical SAM protein [Candidatus Hydrogenedentes bacterium]|nr:radical SAM protein [Candidatus Hydrogenedentota bacterium]HOL77163.1 radical SAM protein [Candidatus Hydrogenedentota bacterium]HPO85898.1 radical SAM protein [Candidatus Hydrogenedentota bacterium]
MTPNPAAPSSPYVPRLIAWELTRTCTLHCRHCRAAARNVPYDEELSFDEIVRVLDNIATKFKPIMILTGGEPLLRADILDIIRHVRACGCRPVLATCGVPLTPKYAQDIKDAGVERISISIDGPDAATHDDFRGMPGAFDATMRGIHAARTADLPFQVNTTVTRRNVAHLERILQLAIDVGAAAFHPFLLVPTGRGKELEAETLRAEEYEQVLQRIYELRSQTPIPFKPTCAPHYYRIFRQNEAAAGREVTVETHGLDAMTKGCMGGNSFAFISHVGKVQICGFLDVEAGNLRKENYDFVHIWQESPLFLELRDYRNYKGDCGRCDYRRWCGGCRARAYAIAGDYLEEEPFCAYHPD